MFLISRRRVLQRRYDALRCALRAMSFADDIPLFQRARSSEVLYAQVASIATYR